MSNNKIIAEIDSSKLEHAVKSIADLLQNTDSSYQPPYYRGLTSGGIGQVDTYQIVHRFAAGHLSLVTPEQCNWKNADEAISVLLATARSIAENSTIEDAEYINSAKTLLAGLLTTNSGYVTIPHKPRN